MVTAVSNYPTFLGIGKETTPGTAVVATVFIPVTSLATEDVKNYVQDTGMRGSAITAYNDIQTQGWGTFNYGMNVYMDTIGVPLKSLLGAEDLTGSGPYVHKMSVLNTGTYQPPTYTVVDYNGVEALAYPFGVHSQVEFSMTANGILSATAQGLGFPSSVVTKPTQSFSAKTAIGAYQTVVTVAGSVTALVESATVTLARTVNPIIALNGSQSPSSMFAADVAMSGSFTALYLDDTFRTPMLNGTSTALDFTITNGADILKLHSTNTIFTAAPPTRGSNGYMEITVAFTSFGNTTDVTTAGTGYSPVLVTLTNSQSTAY